MAAVNQSGNTSNLRSSLKVRIVSRIAMWAQRLSPFEELSFSGCENASACFHLVAVLKKLWADRLRAPLALHCTVSTNIPLPAGRA